MNDIEIARIFDRYYTSKDHISDGAGLGLAICQEIVGRAQGEIEVASTHGKGTVFTVRLPMNNPSMPMEQDVMRA